MWSELLEVLRHGPKEDAEEKALLQRLSELRTRHKASKDRCERLLANEPPRQTVKVRVR